VEHDRKKARGTVVETWELEMVQKVARAFRTAERDELAAELARRLADLKHRLPSDIRDWKAYMAKFLYNKASNWVRDSRARDRRKAVLTQGVRGLGAHNGCWAFGRFEDEAIERRIALVELLEELDAAHGRFWMALVQSNGNQVKAARIAGIHRNTARLWIRKIRTAAERHGLRC